MELPATPPDDAEAPPLPPALPPVPGRAPPPALEVPPLPPPLLVVVPPVVAVAPPLLAGGSGLGAAPSSPPQDTAHSAPHNAVAPTARLARERDDMSAGKALERLDMPEERPTGRRPGELSTRRRAQSELS
jgi:hypothetical protein